MIPGLLLHGAALFVLVLTSWAFGSFDARQDGRPAAFRFAYGLLLLAMACWLLAKFGMLRLGPLLGLLVMVNALAWRAHREALARGLAIVREYRGLATAAGLASLPIAALTLYPPLGFDQTLYHLPFAQAFAREGAIVFLPDLRFPAFPVLAEVLQAAVLLLSSEEATQWVGLVALAATLWLAGVWLRELGVSSGGWWAAAALAGSPAAIYLATCGYVEPLLALAALAALYAAERSRTHDEGSWVFAAGILAGTAASIKYLGIYFVGATALCLLRRGDWRGEGRRLLRYAFALLVFAAPTYAGIEKATGNPLHPFYNSVFGHDAWSADELRRQQGAADPAAAAALLWDITFRREAVGSMPPFSPLYVAGLPLLLWAAWRNDAARRQALVAGGFLLVMPTNAHYFLAIAPCFALAAGAGAALTAREHPRGRQILVALAIPLLLAGPAYAVYQIGRLGPPPSTAAERDATLRRSLPLYPAIAELNRLAPGERVYGAGTERMVAYLEGTLIGDHNGPAAYSRVMARAGEIGLGAALAEHGASKLVVDREFYGSWLALADADPRLQAIWQDDAAVLYQVLPAG